MTFTNPSNGPYQNTKGDIIVGTGAGLQPGILSVGSNNQVLTADSTQTTGTKWAASSGAGSLVLIQTQTASNSASLTFTSGFSYTSYKIIISNLLAVSNSVNLILRVSTNGGSSYLSTNTNYVSALIGTVLSSSGSTGFYLNYVGDGILNNNTYDGEFLFTVGSTDSHLSGVGSYVYYNGSATWGGVVVGGGTVANVNALQFTFDGSSNIASGNISLYGYVQ